MIDLFIFVHKHIWNYKLTHKSPSGNDEMELGRKAVNRSFHDFILTVSSVEVSVKGLKAVYNNSY